ncbi:glycoside hydrolase domain-containing protein [Streptomyces sp. NRRL F-5123]|uniref:glycoside hydrolase domain-containing protein n=1 Tax=Streptomyces sp. NRRL F-5123 TaxID=1463856 RepID=UPI0006938095|nr:glycoside hydrolase domain-containing protein [Streptomyces sp. NRRL F-5123]
MTESQGVDYSSGRPGGAALAAAGIAFAARYLSHNPSKNLTKSEAADLAAHGVWAVVVWETTAQRASTGRAAGIADAKAAAAQAAACGMPPLRPIFFAVDFDASPSAVVAYFQGVVSVLGLARTGVYGGYRVVSYLLDHRLATWAWQTVAWSQGRWDSRAHIRQYASTVRIGGVSCDKNTSMHPDFGQWMPGKTPSEDDMTPDQAAALARVDKAIAGLALAPWTYRNADKDAASVKAGKGHIPDAYSYLVQTWGYVQTLLAREQAQTAAITALAAQLGTGADVGRIVSAVQDAIATATVHVTVDTGDAPAPAAS